MMYRLAVLPLILSFASPVLAADAEAQKCRLMTNASERLACFDIAFPPLPPGSSSQSALPKWEIREETNATGNGKTVLASLTAVSVAGDAAPGSVQLAMRCSGGVTSVLVTTELRLSKLFNVTFVLDGRPIETWSNQWKTSANDSLMVLAGKAQTSGLIRSLKNGKMLAMRVGAQQSFEATFNLGGFDGAANRIASECGWKY